MNLPKAFPKKRICAALARRRRRTSISALFLDASGAVDWWSSRRRSEPIPKLSHRCERSATSEDPDLAAQRRAVRLLTLCCTASVPASQVPHFAVDYGRKQRGLIISTLHSEAGSAGFFVTGSQPGLRIVAGSSKLQVRFEQHLKSQASGMTVSPFHQLDSLKAIFGQQSLKLPRWSDSATR